MEMTSPGQAEAWLIIVSALVLLLQSCLEGSYLVLTR